REELLARDDGAHDGPDVAVGPAERRGGSPDQLRGRRVAHESAGELERDVLRGGRMPRDDVEDILAVLDAAAGREPVAEDDLRARVVHLRIELERTAAELGTGKGPAGERAGDVDHVLLRVAAVDAERVKLEELAAVVLVEPAAAPRELLLLLRREQSDAAVAACSTATGGRQRHEPWAVAVGLTLPVVQIEEHRGALGDRLEQHAEFSERVRADHLALVLRELIALGRPLLDVDREVVEPEVGHDLLELALGKEGTVDASALRLDRDPSGAGRGLAQLRTVGRTELGAVSFRLQALKQLIRRRILPLELLGAGVVALEGGEVLVALGVADALRVKLQVDPLVDSHGPHGLRVAGARAESEPAEEVVDLLVGRLFAR